MTTRPPSLADLAPALSHAGLLTRLEQVVNFAKTNIDRLERHSDLWNEDDGSFVRLVDKIVIESSLFILLASRVPQLPSKLRGAIEDLAARLCPLARSERTKVLLMRFPQTASSLGISHIALTSLNFPDDQFEFLLQRAMSSGQAEAIERLPFRVMDYRWVKRLVDPSLCLDFSDLLPHSILSTKAHPISMTRDDAYALTHALMYETDFGVLPPNSLYSSRVSAMVDAGLAWTLMSEDLDLLGELIIAAAVLRCPWSPYARFAWHVLNSTWDELGFLPGPSFEANVYSALSGLDASAYAFRHLYHTNYVGGILCSVLLQYPERSEAPLGWTAPTKDAVTSDVAEKCRVAVHRATGRYLPEWMSLGLDSSETKAESETSDVMRLESNGEETNEHGAVLHIDLDKASWLDIIQNRAVAFARQVSPAPTQWERAAINAPMTNDELAIVIADMGLIHAARQYDLVDLAESLTEIMRLGLPCSGTVLNALEFLVRQQVSEGAIGAHFVIEENLRSSDASTFALYFAGCLSKAEAYLASESSF